MPWRVETSMSIRREFAEEAERGLYSMTELCARYGVSRRVGYKWLARYETTGVAGLEDQRRVAAHYPNRMADEVAAALLACRQAHPTWGARKLRAYLARREPRLAWPAASTIGELLKRHGLARPRRRRPHPGHPGRPVSAMDAPNAVWSVDFKGQFRLGSGAYCYPLTVVDGYSRYVLAIRGLPAVETTGVVRSFRALFQAYGLPSRIRSDNGVPFATSALRRLSALSVWWIKLGIIPELIEPASPQQNGRHERMHRVLKAEATRPPAASFGAQQRRFTRFREEYNSERPHEALGQGTPAAHYTPSSRSYPAQLPELVYPGHLAPRYVSANGGIRWKNRWVNVSHVLAGEHVGLEEVADGVWSVYFGPVLLGRFDERDGRIRGAHNRNRL
jgi:putative transposase